MSEELKSTKQLKMAVQRQFGMAIKSVAELKIFQEELEYTTREAVSFNTLRRFFNFLPSTKPSTKTISILCKYIGYNNISNFLSQENTDKNWQLWNNTLRIEFLDNLKTEDIMWLIENAKHPNFYLHFASIIKSFIYRKKYDVIVTLFEHNLSDFSMEVLSKFASMLCRLFSSLEKTELQKIIPLLVPLRSFRESVLHWYIDYTNLNGYYGEFLEAALPFSHKESHEYLFYDLILNYRDFLLEKKNIKYIPTTNVKKDFFIVLKGRAYAYNLIYFQYINDDVRKEETWKEIQFILEREDVDIFLFMLEIMTTLILLKEFDKISFLIDEYYEELLAPTNWTGYHVHSTVLLAHSVQLLNEKNFKQAEKTFNLINTKKLDGSYKEYNMIFYHLIEYQIALNSNDGKNNYKSIELNYSRYVNETGFTLFSSNYLKNYLKT